MEDIIIMKDKIFGVLQRVGRSFMLPIALLPVAGLLLGIGSSFTNATTIETYHLGKFIYEGGVLYTILDIMSKTGSAVFDNLALLFAMGVAIGMAKKEKEVAALSGAIAYIVMNTTISALITAKGGVEAMAENSTTSVLGISKLGVLVLNSGYAGTWIYGILERALIPFGLHHVFYMPFWQTELGGSMMIDGNMVAGAQNIFFAELASKSTEVFSVSATRFMAGKFPFMIFGLPAAAFAMYKTARPEKKKVVGSLLLSAALTSMITGITEPLEFTFLFVAPLMYAVHCVLAGLSYMLMHILNVGVGMTFSGGLIDMTLFGILQGNAKTHWIWIVVVGLIYAVVYYFVFYFMITKMNLKTPGREPDDVEPKLYRRSDVNEAKAAKVKSTDKRASDVVSAMILKGLGGKDNLSDVDCCATRLRVTVNDASKVMDDMLKASGASGVIHKGNGVQVIYGPKVSVIKSDLEDFIDSPYSDDPDSIIGTEKASDKIEEKPQTESAENADTNGKTITLYSHMNGTAVKLEDVEDDVFSQKILGEGAAVEPSEGKLYAPCDGKIDSVFDTKHAVNMVSDDGVEILLHIGIDTVKLGGQYFEAHVSDGQEVKKGDLLISFDMDKIKAAGYKVTTPLIIGNTDDYASVEPVAQNSVSAGDMILKIK